MEFFVVVLLFVNMLVFTNNVAMGQNNVCGSTCPCFCDNITSSLNCSTYGISNVAVCGSLDNFAIADFSRNQIDNLPREIVVSGQQCAYDFSENQLRTAVSMFRVECRSSFTLDLSRNMLNESVLNPLNLSMEISFLFGPATINLSHSFIKKLPTDAFRIKASFLQFLTIDLSFNDIDTVRSFVDLSGSFVSLTLLLNDNKIHSVSALDTFSGISDVYVCLSNNRISGLATKNLSSNLNLRLNLENNPWVCNCHQRWIANSTPPLRETITMQPSCHQPSSVKGRPILSLTSNEFVCPPQIDPNAVLVHVTQIGDNVDLRCPFIDDDPPVIFVDWQFSGNIPFNDKPSLLNIQRCVNCSLSINNVNSDLEGDYVCRAFNGEYLQVVQRVEVGATTIANGSPSSSSNEPSAVESNGSSTAAVIILIVLLLIVAVCLLVVGYKYYVLRKEKQNTNKTEVGQDAQRKKRPSIPDVVIEKANNTPHRIPSASPYLVPDNDGKGTLRKTEAASIPNSPGRKSALSAIYTWVKGEKKDYEVPDRTVDLSVNSEKGNTSRVPSFSLESSPRIKQPADDSETPEIEHGHYEITNKEENQGAYEGVDDEIYDYGKENSSRKRENLSPDKRGHRNPETQHVDYEITNMDEHQSSNGDVDDEIYDYGEEKSSIKRENLLTDYEVTSAKEGHQSTYEDENIYDYSEGKS